MSQHAPGTETDPSPLPTPREAVDHPLRRAVVEYLFDADDDEVRLKRVVAAVAASEAGPPVGPVRKRTLESIQVELGKRHLATLEVAGLVTYHIDRNTLALAESPEAVRRHLAAAADGAATDGSVR